MDMDMEMEMRVRLEEVWVMLVVVVVVVSTADIRQQEEKKGEEEDATVGHLERTTTMRASTRRLSVNMIPTTWPWNDTLSRWSIW